jgi:hypothetical protein
MMKQMNETILGISLGSKRSGIAVISYGTLIHWHIHSFFGTWSEKKRDCILDRYESYIKKYQAKRVFIKVPPETHHSPALIDLLKLLLKRCQYHGCMVAYKTKADIKADIPEVENAHALMQYVANRFPVLSAELEQELQHRQPYHIKMFEAVLVAHIMHQRVTCARNP